MTTLPDIEYDQLGNDLYAKFDCVNSGCKGEKWTSCDNYWPHKIRLVGYDDENFYDNVHKEPHTRTCKCGQGYKYRWTRDGVELEVVNG